MRIDFTFLKSDEYRNRTALMGIYMQKIFNEAFRREKFPRII